MEHFRFEDTKKIVSPEKFRVSRETGPRSQQKTKSFCKIIVGIGCGKRTRITLGEDKWSNHHKAMLEYFHAGKRSTYCTSVFFAQTNSEEIKEIRESRL